MDQHIATPLGVRLDQASGLFQVSRRVFTDPMFLELEHQKDLREMLALLRP